MLAGGIDGLGLAVVAQCGLDVGMGEEVARDRESLRGFAGDGGDGAIAEQVRVDSFAEGTLSPCADTPVDRIGTQRTTLRRKPERFLVTCHGEERAVMFEVTR